MHLLLIVDNDIDVDDDDDVDNDNDDDETSNLKNKTLKIWACIKNGGNDEKLDFKNKRSFLQRRTSFETAPRLKILLQIFEVTIKAYTTLAW